MTNVHHDDSWVDVRGDTYLAEGTPAATAPTTASRPTRCGPGGAAAQCSAAITVAASNTVTGGRGLMAPGVPAG
ncbi:hypothetical protein GCM10028832_22900 [Streptomyces sparsus]